MPHRRRDDTDAAAADPAKRRKSESLVEMVLCMIMLPLPAQVGFREEAS